MKLKSKFFRKFGFELEFSTPLADIEKDVKSIITKIYGKNHLKINGFDYNSENKFDKWELKYDGSTESELSTPISTIYNFEKINQVLNELSKKNFKITDRDSVHIHMQANDVPKHNIIAAWIQIENAIMKCFPKHRRNNGYCQKLVNKKYKKMSDFFIDAENEANAHHSILSLNYYPERKTVEFRVMEGNVNADDILPWIKFCMLFLNYAKTIDPVEIICSKTKLRLPLNDIIALLNINNKEIVDFLVRREKKFRKN